VARAVGEWHCDGDSCPGGLPWRPSRPVLTAYANAFKKTKVLVRYPSGRTTSIVGTRWRRMITAVVTTTTRLLRHVCMFMPAMTNVGAQALNKWINYPIAGRCGQLLRERLTNPVQQQLGAEFCGCVELTHATYMLDTSCLRRGGATHGVCQLAGGDLGARLRVQRGSLGGMGGCRSGASMVGSPSPTPVRAVLLQWPVQLAAANPQGQIIQTWSPVGAQQHLSGSGTAQLSTALTNPPPALSRCLCGW